MADNVQLNANSSVGDVAAADDVGGVKYQRVKITIGADGTAVGDVSSANPMPVVNSAVVTVTGSVTAAITGPVTVQGSVTAAITGPVTVTGSVSAVGQVSVAGSVAISGPVTVTGSVSVLGSLSASINNLLGATVVAGATVVGTVGIAKRVDTQATVGSAVNTATPLHVNEFGSLWVVAEAGDAQATNGGGVTGINVFFNGTTVGQTSVVNNVAIAGPVTVSGTVAATQSGAWSISATSNIANLLGASVNPGSTVVGTIGIGKRVDALSATVGSTVGGAVALQTDAFGSLWVVSNSLGIAGPVTVTGSVTAAITGPVTVTGSVTSAITGPVTVQGAVSVVGQISIVGVVPAHTIFGSVSLAGGTVGISGPVTVMGTVTANLAPTAAGGLTTFRSVTIASAAATVSAAAASVFGLWVGNTATSTRFIKFYNTTVATVGTTTPFITLPIPGNSSDDVAGLFGSAHGIAFSQGIMVGVTTDYADAGSLGGTAGDVLLNVFYK